MIGLGLFTKEEAAKTANDDPLWFRYFPHGLSHHIGLDVHDPGKKQDALYEGMVVTCEPGIYIPEENIGVRIETDLIITREAPLDLFADIPRETKDIESLMLTQ